MTRLQGWRAWLGLDYREPEPPTDFPQTIDVLRAVQALAARLDGLLPAGQVSSPKALDCGHTAARFVTNQRTGTTTCTACHEKETTP
jgi:cytochrome c553